MLIDKFAFFTTLYQVILIVALLLFIVLAIGILLCVKKYLKK